MSHINTAMSSEEDFTDEEFVDDPPAPSSVVQSTATTLGKHAISNIEDEVYSRRVTSCSNKVQSVSLRFPDSNSDEEQIISSASNLASSVAVPATAVEAPTAIPSTSSTSLPGTSTGNDAYMRFLAERKDENFSSDEFSSDEQESVNSLDDFEDPNDNSKVKRDLQALQAYLSQDDSSCDESRSVKSVSVIGAIPHLSSPIEIEDDDEITSTVKLIAESLKQNKACVERLDKAKESVEIKLAEIRARFTVVTTEISAAIKVKKSDGWMLNLCHTSPYFRDDRGFPPPYNADYEGKKARKEIIDPKYFREHPWLVRDSQFICEEVRKWEIEGLLLKREQERNAIRRKIAQSEDEEEKAALTEQLNAEDVFNVDNLSLEEVVGSRKDGRPDWMAMSANKLGVDRSAETIKAVWENYLDPRLPKGGWNDEEDLRLQEIATEHGEQNWPMIAEKLGTGRTGFVCFMRYKGALDRDFIGMRFSAQEDGFVRRSVAATTFNQHVSWDQTEFLYRGRRDKRALKLRWLRLEADASEKQRKGKFTESEDLAILHAAQELGTSDFAAIARSAFGTARTASQVHLRYLRLTTENKRGQWTLDEDILLVRLVSQMGRNWRKVREAFGNHRTKEQLRFRHESVAKHVSERLSTTQLSLEEVLMEMASNVRVNTRLQNGRVQNMRYQARISDMTDDQLRERQEKLIRKRRSQYVRMRESAEIDDEYLKFFAVRYTPPQSHELPLVTPTPHQLANALSLLLAVFDIDVPLPNDDVLDPINSDPVLGPAIAYLRLNDASPGQMAPSLAEHEQNSSTNLNNANVGQTAPKSAFLRLNKNSEGQRSLKTSSSESPASSISASGNPFTLHPCVKSEADDNNPIELPPSNFNAVKLKSAGPMVSIPSLEVMKSSAQGVKPVAMVEATDPSVSNSGTLRRSARGVRFVANKTSAAADKAKTLNNKKEKPVPKDKIVNKKQLVPKVAKMAGNKKQPVATNAKTVEINNQMAAAIDNMSKVRTSRCYAKSTKKVPVITKPTGVEKPVESTVCIDLEPLATVASKSLVPLSSLLPLAPDVTPLKSKVAAKAFTDQIEVICNGKKIVLTKVASLPPGIKVTRTCALPPPTTTITNAITDIDPLMNETPSKQPSPTQPPPSKKKKTGTEIEVDPWTGLPTPGSSASSHLGVKYHRRFVMRKGVDFPNSVPAPVLPPGLVTMIGIRTLLGSMNSMASLVSTKEPQPDSVCLVNQKGRQAARQWESRMFALFSFPALLARNPLLRAPKAVHALVADMENMFPPIGTTQLPPVIRSYSRKRPRNDQAQETALEESFNK